MLQWRNDRIRVTISISSKAPVNDRITVTISISTKAPVSVRVRMEQ